jgi:uncharacterized protein
MKILVDLIHPANVHYFKNFIFDAQYKNHKILITAREKDVLLDLLDEYNLPYINMGRGTIGKGGIGKMLFIIKAFFLMLPIIFKFRPNIVLSFGSTPCAVASFLLNVPHIAFEDTEHARLNRKLYLPFTQLIATPYCFYEEIGKKHFRFNGYMELFYLHTKRFKPDEKILDSLLIKKGEPFVIFRFVSWGAFHDIGQKGIDNEEKLKLVNHFSKKNRVFISSEGELPDCLKKYQLNVPASQLHNVLAFSKLYIGEGGTMASEASMLGIPSIYVNSLPLMGYLKDSRDCGLLLHLSNFKDVIKTGDAILNREDYEEFYSDSRKILLENKIDPTSMLEWLIDNYPESKKILLNNPDYQQKFI